MNSPLARATLHRRHNPDNEYRYLDVLQDGTGFSIVQKIRFAGHPDALSHVLTKTDSEHVIRQFLNLEIERLCKEEGFTLVRSEGETFLNGYASVLSH